MNNTLYAKLKPEIMDNRRNLLAFYGLLCFINALSFSSLGPSILTTFLSSRKSSEFIAQFSIYSQYMGMSLPTLIPWNTVLFLGCCYMVLCRFGRTFPLAVNALLASLMFLSFKLPVALLMTVDKGRIFSSLPGLEGPLTQTGILLLALGLVGFIIFLILFFSTHAWSGRSRAPLNQLDRSGYMIRCLILSVTGAALSALIAFTFIKTKLLDEDGVRIISAVTFLIMLIIQISWTVQRMRDAGLNPYWLLLLLLLPEIPLGGVYLMHISGSLMAVATGEMIVSLFHIISAVLFFCIALWPGETRPATDQAG